MTTWQHLREEIAGLTRAERIELARWIVDNIPECVAAVDERRPTLVDIDPEPPQPTMAGVRPALAGVATQRV